MPHKYPIIIDYSPDKARILRKFCGITGVTIKAFTVTALENEMAYQLEQMEPAKRKTIEELLTSG